jgi:hypothetical protein
MELKTKPEELSSQLNQLEFNVKIAKGYSILSLKGLTSHSDFCK